MRGKERGKRRLEEKIRKGKGRGGRGVEERKDRIERKIKKGKKIRGRK